jgi:gamma-glutamyltranspeptidase
VMATGDPGGETRVTSDGQKIMGTADVDENRRRLVASPCSGDNWRQRCARETWRRQAAARQDIELGHR